MCGQIRTTLRATERKDGFIKKMARLKEPVKGIVIAGYFLVSKAKAAKMAKVGKDINQGHIEDYLFGIQAIAEKTRYNKMSHLRDFWKWLLQRGAINLAQMPMFPEI